MCKRSHLRKKRFEYQTIANRNIFEGICKGTGQHSGEVVSTAASDGSVSLSVFAQTGDLSKEKAPPLNWMSVRGWIV